MNTRKRNRAQVAGLRLAKDLALPIDLVTQTIGIVAKRRAGKSYLARRLVEQLHHAGQQVVIIDPKGDWTGILSSADGKAPGLPVVIIGGERGHVPLEATGGEVVARLVVEEGISILLDLSLFRKHEIATFMQTFLESLYRFKAIERYRTPCMLVIDEADAIAPQRPQPNEARMLGAAEDIVRRGGQRGLGCTLITQRTAVLSKNVLTQVQMLIALRTISPQDLGAMNAWIDVHGTPAEKRALMASLPSLPVGDAWVWSPGWPNERGIFQRIHTLPIETFDSGATPKAGQKPIEPKTVAEVDLEAVRRQMEETIERAKATDPAALRKRVAALEAELTQAQAARKPERVEVEKPVLTAQDRKAVEQLSAKATALIDRLQALLSALEQKQPKYTPPLAAPKPARAVLAEVAHRTISRSNNVSKTPSEGSLPDGERKILIATAQHQQGVTREQLTILTGYKRSTRDAYIQRLRSRGYLDDVSGNVTATPEGIAALGCGYSPLPTGSALRDHWLRRLPSGESAVLSVLVEAFPDAVSRDDISQATGFKRSTRDAYLQRLGTRKLAATVRDGIVASDVLFD
ncbi:MAG TPA: DUF87 domain-containing protein [Polyangiales bacterium]|nr:DUF87 domain-containing protein [Polyangiales bacterium]